MEIVSVNSVSKRFYHPIAKSCWIDHISALLLPRYEEKIALENLSFTIQQGEFVGYIGPNGAGKSTTLKLLSGILTPDEGEVLVFGKNPSKKRLAVVNQLGVVFGQRSQLIWDLPAIDSYRLNKSLYQIPEVSYQNRLSFLIKKLDVERLYQIPVRQLSLGERMRCDLVAALLHNPKLLFLDEPTIGLDLLSKQVVRSVIADLNRQHGVTIILTTHDMHDIEALCSRLILVNNGRVVLEGTMNDLQRKVAPLRHLVVELVDLGEFREIRGVRLLKQEGCKMVMEFDPSVISNPDLISNIMERYTVKDFKIKDPSIEDLVSKFYLRDTIECKDGVFD